jgi:hypothetical protein
VNFGSLEVDVEVGALARGRVFLSSFLSTTFLVLSFPSFNPAFPGRVELEPSDFIFSIEGDAKHCAEENTNHVIVISIFGF